MPKACFDGKDLHRTIFDKTAAYLFHMVQNHPFVDGNGRTARLLMGLLLGQAGYPPALIRPEDRQRYISAIEHGQLGGSLAESAARLPVGRVLVDLVDLQPIGMVAHEFADFGDADKVDRSLDPRDVAGAVCNCR